MTPDIKVPTTPRHTAFFLNHHCGLWSVVASCVCVPSTYISTSGAETHKRVRDPLSSPSVFCCTSYLRGRGKYLKLLCLSNSCVCPIWHPSTHHQQLKLWKATSVAISISVICVAQSNYLHYLCLATAHFGHISPTESPRVVTS